MVKKGAATTEDRACARAKGSRRFLLFAGVVLAACTGGGPKAADAPVGASTVAGPALDGRPVQFAYDSLDERPVTSDAMRGRPSVIAFVTTWDLSSQAEIDFLVPMAKNDAGHVSYAMVALQEREDRELVELYAQKLGVAFPVALADKATIAGGGPFGDVHAVPTVVVLDREGRIAWEHVGLAKGNEIRTALRSLGP